ncbi:hypothetical protein MSG28_011663 [Choristoneura fumiferana]|uniref:Uncharacterized protein n=1 Tax=Choristoneura fumiferana TaxID=7141 RepID=A0ACC0KL35_CHOFU|nr:hypothetical protein MSG28_011663 [Choristoneura fumiferana]
MSRLTLNSTPCHQVVEPINRLLESIPFDSVFYSLDWHPPDHVSFIDNVHMRELHPSSPVAAMVDGRDRRPELGYKLAMELKTAMNDQK